MFIFLCFTFNQCPQTNVDQAKKQTAWTLHSSGSGLLIGNYKLMALYRSKVNKLLSNIGLKCYLMALNRQNLILIFRVILNHNCVTFLFISSVAYVARRWRIMSRIRQRKLWIRFVTINMSHLSISTF